MTKTDLRGRALMIMLMVFIGWLIFAVHAKGMEKLNPKLAALTSVWVEPKDALGDGVPVAACFASHLAREIPVLKVSATKDEAQAVITIDADLPSETRTYMLGVFGGAPSGRQVVTLATGEVLLNDKSMLKRAVMTGGATKNVGIDVPCGLADDMIMHLRDAMRKARDGK